MEPEHLSGNKALDDRENVVIGGVNDGRRSLIYANAAGLILQADHVADTTPS